MKCKILGFSVLSAKKQEFASKSISPVGEIIGL
jgi:hypothetical protein